MQEKYQISKMDWVLVDWMEPRYKNGKESVSDDPRALSWEN